MKIPNLDLDASALLAQMTASGQPPFESLSAIAARAAFENGLALLAADPEPVAEVRELSAAGPAGPLRLRLYRPASPRATLPALVYLHGGGWVLGSLESHDSVCRALANRAGCVVIAVDYRLAPEHPFPAALEDAYAAVCWVVTHAAALGCDPQRISVGGDSAGGNLAAVICLQARDFGGPRLCAQLLVYPVTDFTMSSASQREFADGLLLTRANQRWFHKNYVGGHGDLRDWRLSPLHAANHSNLPRALVLTAEYDPLRDEGEQYAMKLADAHVPVGLWRVPGQIHGFLSFGKMMRVAERALAEAAAALKIAAELG